MATEQQPAAEPNPNESPFELPPIEGIPFDDDSEEAQAIKRVIEQSERDRAATGADS
jgi:hypothetical protein